MKPSAVDLVVSARDEKDVRREALVESPAFEPPTRIASEVQKVWDAANKDWAVLKEAIGPWVKTDTPKDSDSEAETAPNSGPPRDDDQNGGQRKKRRITKKSSDIPDAD